ncbi:MAG: hypothetical protein JXD21_06030 [Candidatus Omnitrophica bacterium]|nr:hypothetical protein [Candidatus Omnitrophota bacterium]
MNRSETKIPCVVLGLGVNGLGVVRSLARRGLEVVGAYSEPRELGRYSRYCRPVRFSPLGDDEGRFLSQLCELGGKLTQAVLFATNDRYVEFVSEHREKLSEYFLIRMADKELVHKLNSKNGIRELALERGVKIPQTRQVLSSADVDHIKENFSFPLIVKPRVTFNNVYFRQKKNMIVDAPRQLEKMYDAVPGLFHNAMIQEVVRGGDDYIVMVSLYFNAHSQVVASSTVRKVRQYPPDYGIACFLKTEPLPKIRDIAVPFLEKLRFQGIILLEFAECRATGEYYLLEANLRSCYVNQLFTDCGVDFNYIAYCDIVSPSSLAGINFNQKDDMYWLDLIRDFASFRRKYRTGVLKFLPWMLSLFRVRSCATFAFDDPMPFLVSMFRFLRQGMGYPSNWIKKTIKKG